MTEPGLIALLIAAATAHALGDGPQAQVARFEDPPAATAPAAASSRGEDPTDGAMPKWVKYGLLGAGAGALAGGATGYLLTERRICLDEAADGAWSGGCDTERHTVAGALIGAGFSAAVGTLIGLNESRVVSAGR